MRVRFGRSGKDESCGANRQVHAIVALTATVTRLQIQAPDEIARIQIPDISDGPGPIGSKIT
jgi:hypothetical protein